MSPDRSGSRASSAPLIETLLRDAGFVGLAAEKARSVLEGTKLTRAGKSRIALEKVPRALEVLDRHLSRHCGSTFCRELLERMKTDAEPVPVPREYCEACGGSDIAGRAIELSLRLDRQIRIVVVGGSPRVRDELAALNVPRLSFRLVSGLDRRTSERARADRDWADLVIVLGSSELKHKISNLYRDRDGEEKVIVVAGRGAASVLAAIELWRSRRPVGPRRS
jgi:hypothetical protein